MRPMLAMATGWAMVLITAAPVASGATQTTPCADPAVDIQAVLVSRTGPDTGRVRITGQIKNLGSEPWIAASRQHRLRMELVVKKSGAPADGDLVEPPVDIARLDSGGQFRIDHQLNWKVSQDASYPRFLIRFTELGKPDRVSSRADCRSDNNRKEIAPADINQLFSAPPMSAIPLKIVSYRLLGGEGINTVESTLTYNRNSPAAGKITASVAAPYSGSSEELSIAGNSGTAPMRVHIPCDRNPASGPSRVTGDDHLPVVGINKCFGCAELGGRFQCGTICPLSRIVSHKAWYGHFEQETQPLTPTSTGARASAARRLASARCCAIVAALDLPPRERPRG